MLQASLIFCDANVSGDLKWDEMQASFWVFEQSFNLEMVYNLEPIGFILTFYDNVRKSTSEYSHPYVYGNHIHIGGGGMWFESDFTQFQNRAKSILWDTTP